jgi:hypothetical protein
MRQCFVNLLQALRANCQARINHLVEAPKGPQSVEAFYRRIAKDLQPHEALLLSHVLPQCVCFEKLGFSELDQVQAAAHLRETVEEVLTTVLTRADDTVEQPSHLPAVQYANDLRFALSRRGLLQFMPQFKGWGMDWDSVLYSLLQESMELLVPLALAACMWIGDHPAEHRQPGELPDATAAAEAEMWLRDTVMSWHHLASSANVWKSEDDAQLERDRRALVDAAQLLRSAADGTAAAELSRVREQLVCMQADMQQRSQDLLQQIETLTRYTVALQRRLESAQSQQP